MTDFLNQNQELKVPATEAPSSDARTTRGRRFKSRRPGSTEEPENPRPGSGVKSPQKKKKKEESKLFTDFYGIVFLFLIGAFLGGGYLLLNPMYAEFKSLNGKIETELQTLSSERAFLDSLDRSIAAADAIPEETLDRVERALPREIGVPTMLLEVSQIAGQSGVNLISVQFAPVTESAEDADARPLGRSTLELEPVALSLSIEAPGYQAMRSFLYNLEQSLRVMDVNTIAVTGNPSNDMMSYSVELTAYSIKTLERTSAARSPDDALLMMDDPAFLEP
ncbi:hypothetical protein GF380_06630 [Candidatus Uhrbacteria bacterium]|nr:hypothetical protein [Candidatus Uhrbacteria bacterium]MBD3284610.1 hypothetical protein [Candidatus Uhrbacteria bacterium]